MPDDSRIRSTLAMIDGMISHLTSAMVHTEAARALATDLHQALARSVETSVELPVQQPLKRPTTREEIQAEHRRAHRSGCPGKIEGDPELEAFILARIDTLTFAQIVSQVQATFPPERRCSISSLGRWWQKRQGG